MTDEIASFNYAEIFDENTVKIYDKYVNVAKILENRRENQAQKERRMAEKAASELEAKQNSEMKKENGDETSKDESDKPPPAKKSKKSEKRGQNKKRKHTGY